MMPPTPSAKPFLRSLLLLAAAAALFGCAPSVSVSRPASPHFDPIAALLQDAPPLAAMGHAIQVGAFSQIDNAVRLEKLLQDRGIDAYYFRDECGLYKVRFGNHSAYQDARQEAESLRAQGLIEAFFIVLPEAHVVVRTGREDVREELVRTALRFLGVPYRWGGTDGEDGFDCSGLTMVSYRLNGLNLPRVSASQFQAGRSVSPSQLRKGDLVFFATSGGRRVSHVGMYIGDGKFVHAPRSGQTVRVEALSNPYFQRTYLGARTYL